MKKLIIKHLRVLIVFFLLFNLAMTISFSNFFPLERGIEKLDFQKALKDKSDDFSPELLELIEISKTGKFNNFFTEEYNGAYGDALHYMKMAIGESTIPPYSLRPLMPKLVGSITWCLANILDNQNAKATQLNLLNPTMSILNSLFLAIASIFLFLSIKKYLKDELISGLLTVVLIVNIGTMQTSQFFMLDSVSYSIGAIAIYFFTVKKYWHLSIAVAVGILFKEILIIYSILLVYPFLLNKNQFINSFKLLLIPFLVFTGIRLLMKVDPLSMNYDWDISKGEIKLKYINMHIGSLKNFLGFVIRLFITFGVLWFLAFTSVIDKEKKLVLLLFIVIFSAILANIILASRVPRVVFIVYPLIAVLSAIGTNKLLNLNSKSQYLNNVLNE